MTGVPTLLGLFVLATAAFALTRRNTVHAALCFILTWLGLSGFFLWLGADFVAFAQVLIYVGAVSMVVLFAVLLTGRSRPESEAAEMDSATRAASGAAAAVVVAGVIGYAVVKTPLGQDSAVKAATVRDLGAGLMGPHAASLLVVGVLLTVALIGAIVLAAGEGKRK